MIKEAILQEEKEKIKEFLLTLDLDYDQNVDTTLYVCNDDGIIGTVSKEGYIIKCLGVKKSERGSSLALSLVSEIISRIIFDGYNYYQVFTKLEYRDVFLNMGFCEIAKTEKTVVLESKGNNIDDYLKKEVKKITFSTNDVASVVINANPITNGHVALVEIASKEHDHVIVFVLEEDKSFFSFKERFSLAYLALSRIPNVLVMPSSKYIISSLTFPTYFLKNETVALKEYALIDATIFKDYFMKYFKISCRYVGSEENRLMKVYNETLKEVLGDKLIEVERFDGISASTVRGLIKENRIEEAIELVLESTRFLLNEIAKEKLNN